MTHKILSNIFTTYYLRTHTQNKHYLLWRKRKSENVTMNAKYSKESLDWINGLLFQFQEYPQYLWLIYLVLQVIDEAMFSIHWWWDRFLVTYPSYFHFRPNWPIIWNIQSHKNGTIFDKYFQNNYTIKRYIKSLSTNPKYRSIQIPNSNEDWEILKIKSTINWLIKY